MIPILAAKAGSAVAPWRPIAAVVVAVFGLHYFGIVPLEMWVVWAWQLIVQPIIDAIVQAVADSINPLTLTGWSA